MESKNIIIDEQELTYEDIKQMKEHASKYEYVADKKEFLKGSSAYEQKYILLNANKPIDVLNYLVELDLDTTRTVLNSLNFDDITKILQKFTLEDKKNFYTNFKDLSLVNLFILYDKDTLEYIDDLTLERKVEILESSKPETLEATLKVYETIPEEQRDYVSEKLSTSNITTYVGEDSFLNNETNTDSLEIDSVDKEEKTDELENKEEKLNNEKKDINMETLIGFLKSNERYYKENIEEFKNLNFQDPNFYLALTPELRLIVLQDYELFMNKNKLEKLNDKELSNSTVENKKEEPSSENQRDLYNEFIRVKNECEIHEIEELKDSLNENMEEEISKTM